MTKLESGQALKEKGIDQVTNNNLTWIEKIRNVAVSICNRRGSVTADELRVWADENDLHPRHPNAWGGVFRGRCWKAFGYKKSVYRSNHARRITIWEYQGE